MIATVVVSAPSKVFPKTATSGSLKFMLPFSPSTSGKKKKGGKGKRRGTDRKPSLGARARSAGETLTTISLAGIFFFLFVEVHETHSFHKVLEKKIYRRSVNFSHRVEGFSLDSPFSNKMSNNSEVLVLRGTLEGHNGWVTSLSTCAANPDLLLSGSRDKTLIVWQLTRDENQYGIAKKALRGHSHIVQDCQLTPDGQYALSGSWDRTLRLWSVATGQTVTRFDGHQGDVMSVSISRTVRQFVSASRDKTIKVWNALGHCISTLNSHQDWVSSVECSPSKNTIIYSAGWDKAVKVCV